MASIGESLFDKMTCQAMYTTPFRMLFQVNAVPFMPE